MVVTRQGTRTAAGQRPLDAFLIFIEAAPKGCLPSLKTLRLICKDARHATNQRVRCLEVPERTDPTNFEQHLGEILPYIETFSLSSHREQAVEETDIYLSSISTHCALNLRALTLHISSPIAWASTAALGQVEEWPRITHINLYLDFVPDPDFSAGFLWHMPALTRLTINQIRAPLQLRAFGEALGPRKAKLLNIDIGIEHDEEGHVYSDALRSFFNGVENVIKLTFNGTGRHNTSTFDFLDSTALQKLESLKIGHASASFESIRAANNLQSIWLHACTLSGFSSLTSANFPQLSKIHAHECDALDDDWSDLAKLDLPKLNWMNFSDTYGFEEADFRYLAEAMPKLPKLRTLYAEPITLVAPFVPFDGKLVLENFFSAPYVMESLKCLSFSHCQFSAEALELLCFKYATKCPNLLDLAVPLQGAPAVAVLATSGKLGAWPNLKMLSVNDVLQDMKECETQSQIEVAGVLSYDDISDDERRAIRGIKEHLKMPSHALYAAFEEAWPGITVELDENAYFH